MKFIYLESPTETSTMGTGNEKNVKWNAESSSCESDARTSCSEYKEDLRSFYKYNLLMCYCTVLINCSFTSGAYITSNAF